MSPPPARAPSQDDGIVEQQLHDLLECLIGWLVREKSSLLQKFIPHKFDHELMLTDIEIYLSEEVKLRRFEAFETWLFGHASYKYERSTNFSSAMHDRPAMFLCVLKHLTNGGDLASQIRIFRGRQNAQAQSVPQPAASASASSSFGKFKCPNCSVSACLPPVYRTLHLTRLFFKACFTEQDEMEMHLVIEHIEVHDTDESTEVPVSFIPCENFGPYREQITAHQPALIARTLEAFRQPQQSLVPMSPPSALTSLSIFGLWRGLEGHNNSCYFDVLVMAMFAFHDRFDELFSPEKLKQAHHDDAMLLRMLADLVVRPLRERMFVPRSAFGAIRQHLSDVTKIHNYANFGLMDPSELLMHFDEHLPGGLKNICSYHSNTKLTTDIVISPVNTGHVADLTAQKLLDLHCHEMELVFEKAPKAFFLQMRLDTESAQW